MMNGQCLAAETKDLLNPFVHNLELTSTYEKIKYGILTVVVLPVRLFVILSLFVLAWLLACIGLFGLSDEEIQSKPLPPWRRLFRRLLMSWLLRIAMFAFGFHRIKVTGVRASKFRAPLVTVAPHSSFFDIIPAIFLSDISVVTRQENLMMPFVGKLINFTQPVYVRRDDRDSRQNTIKQIIDRATSELDWSQMLIFPEGTCTNRSCLITFKPGAFYPGVPVQPVILRYPNKLDTVTWTWEGPGALKLMWLTLVQPHSNCEIEFLPVYNPSLAEKRNPKLYAENVRQLMARALGVPTIDYTYDDCQMVAKANVLSIPRTCLMLKIHKIRIRLGLSQGRKEEKLVSASPDQLHSEQRVDLAQFSERLSILPSEPALLELFSLLEPDEFGCVDMSEYLLTALLVERASSQHEMLEMAFSLGGGGRLSRTQLATVLRLVLQMGAQEAEEAAQGLPADHDGLIAYDVFDSHMNKRPESDLGNNNNGSHPKAD